MASALLVGAATGAVLFAAPASAHATAVTGVTKCLTETGNWEVTWTLTNDYGTVAKIVNLTSTPAITPVPTEIPANGEIKVTVTVTNAVKLAEISFTSQWGTPPSTNRNTRGGGGDFFEDKDNWAKVPIPDDCKVPATTTPPAPPVETKTTPVVPAAPQLPVTGDRSWILAVGGVAVLAIGVLLIVLVPRHRRARAAN